MSAILTTPPMSASVRGVWRAASQSSSDWWGPRLIGLIIVVWLASFPLSFDVSLVTLTFVAFGMAAFGIVNPSVGLLGAGILCTLDAMSRSFIMTGGLLRYNSLNYVLIGMMVLALPLFERLKDVQTRLLQGFTLLMILDIAISTDKPNGLQHAMNVVAVFGILIYFLRARSEPRMHLWLARVCGTLSAFGGMVFFLQIDRLPWLRPDEQDRFMNANAFSYFPLTGLFAICLAYPFVRPTEQTRLGLLAMADLVWVFLSGSRGSMLVGMICLIFLLATTAGFSKRALFLTVAPIVGIAVLSVFGNLQEQALHRIYKLFDSSYSMSGRTSGRSDVAIIGWSIFLGKPLGAGTGGFASEYANADFDELAFAGTHKQAHSGWVKTLVENGILGAAMLFLYVVSFIPTGWKRGRRGALALGFMVTAILLVAFFSAEFQSKGLWFLAAGATAVLNYAAAESQERKVVIVRD